MKIAATVFDAFGTLVEIRRPTHPYRQLLREGKRQGRQARENDIRTIMTRPMGLAEAADYLGIRVAPSRLRELEGCLEREVESICRFPEALEAIEMLRTAGVSLGVCSNLALPYGPPIERLFPQLDAYSFSYQVGAMKPNPLIYEHACRSLGIAASSGLEGRVVMIGDSIRCDRDGPAQLGISGVFLSRGRAGGVSNLVGFARSILGYE
ncbi:HAD family hydrolase [Pseudomonas putida]|uniref:HAD family hydrolase n=1 Tax=Pseudomonas putida TaxID=303 RepID=UPI00037F27F2|nr:HAD family hydrolase [Pseudomonas putida]